MTPDNATPQENSGRMWPSYRKFIVQSIVRESESAKSLYLVPADGGQIAPYHPGQHLPLRLPIPGQSRPVIRCYTLSDSYNAAHYRLTIKREGSPPNRPEVPTGLSSTYFHDQLRVQDVIEAKMPAGNFYLDLAQNHPVVMIAGGIGVTPMMSMLNAACRSGSTREIYFLFALRHGGDHVFQQHLQSLRAECPNIRMHVLYEHPRPQDRLHVDYDRTGRVDIALLRQLLPNLDMEYYVCGPPGMMKAISAGLFENGILESKVRTESFGPSSVSFRTALLEQQQELSALDVTFLRSGVTVQWSKDSGTLLDVAEAYGVNIDFGCRYGDCATCSTPLISGRVTYLHPTGAHPDPGTCLPCSCKPETPVVLDA